MLFNWRSFPLKVEDIFQMLAIPSSFAGVSDIVMLCTCATLWIPTLFHMSLLECIQDAKVKCVASAGDMRILSLLWFSHSKIFSN